MSLSKSNILTLKHVDSIGGNDLDPGPTHLPTPSELLTGEVTVYVSRVSGGALRTASSLPAPAVVLSASHGAFALVNAYDASRVESPICDQLSRPMLYNPGRMTGGTNMGGSI